MARGSKISTDDVARILKLAAAAGWNAKANGMTGSYHLYPSNGSPALALRPSKSGKQMLFAQFRSRGLEIDPMRIERKNGQVKARPKQSKTDVLEAQVLAEATDTATGDRPPKPLPLGYYPSVFAVAYGFTTHALERMEQRNFHLFEVYAAIDFPDYVERARGLVTYNRGDTRAVCNPDTQSIVTVVCINSRKDYEAPRVMQVPIPVEEPVKTTKQVPDPFAAPAIPSWQDMEYPLSHRLRWYLINRGEGTIVTIGEITEALPEGKQDGVYAAITVLLRKDLVTRRARGELVVADVAGLAKMPGESPAWLTGRAHAVLRGEVVPVRTAVLEVLRKQPVGKSFTTDWMHTAIGGDKASTIGNVRTLLNSLVDSGHLDEPQIPQGLGTTKLHYNLRQRLLSLDEFVARHREFTLADVARETGYATHRLGSVLMAMYPDELVRKRDNFVRVTEPVVAPPTVELTGILDTDIPDTAVVDTVAEDVFPEEGHRPETVTFEPEMREPVESEPVETVETVVLNGPVVVHDDESEPAAIPAPRKAMTMLDDDLADDAVGYGFDFMALPDTFVITVAGLILRHIDQLHANSPNWARVAVYDTSVLEHAEDVALKNAEKVQRHLDDDLLQFKVRWTSETQVGVFVRVRPTQAGG